MHSAIDHTHVQKIERVMLHGLRCEWENVLAMVGPSPASRMRPPLFGLNDATGIWGSWLPGRREISLSRRLVHGQTWDAVKEVLRHEMAHQMADEILGAGGETAHGPAFREACRILRAKPRASGSFSTVDQRVREGETGEGDRTMARVIKLLALAESPHRHEAEAAMAKAHDLILRYNLEAVRSGGPRGYESISVGRPALRHPREAAFLGNLLQDFYFVQSIWIPGFVLQKGRMGRVLELSGTPRNLRLAHYVYDFVLHYVDTQWTGYNGARRLNRYRKSDFAVGIIQGFHRKLERNREDARRRTGKSGMVLVEDRGLTAYVGERYPNVRTERRRSVRQDPRVLEDGRRTGEKMVIRKGVTDRTRVGGLLGP